MTALATRPPAQRPAIRAFAGVFANVGRDKDEHHSTRWADTHAIEELFSLAEKAPDGRWVVQLAEVNEGDDNDEMALVDRMKPRGSRLYCPSSREPMVLGPGFGPAKGSVLWVPHTAVPRWSPQRSVNRVRLNDEPLTFFTYHHAAGAHGQGERPKAAIPELNHSWDALQARKEAESNAERQAGRCSFAMCDVNDYEWARQPHEVTTFHERTDWGRARPAAGYRARFTEGATVRLGIDSHKGHKVRGGFPVAKVA